MCKSVAVVLAIGVLFVIVGQSVDKALSNHTDKDSSYNDVLIAVFVQAIAMLVLLVLPYVLFTKTAICPLVLRWYIVVVAVWVISLFAHHGFPAKLHYLLGTEQQQEQEQEQEQQKQQESPEPDGGVLNADNDEEELTESLTMQRPPSPRSTPLDALPALPAQRRSTPLATPAYPQDVQRTRIPY